MWVRVCVCVCVRVFIHMQYFNEKSSFTAKFSVVKVCRQCLKSPQKYQNKRHIFLPFSEFLNADSLSLRLHQHFNLNFAFLEIPSTFSGCVSDLILLIRLWHKKLSISFHMLQPVAHAEANLNILCLIPPRNHQSLLSPHICKSSSSQWKKELYYLNS